MFQLFLRLRFCLIGFLLVACATGSANGPVRIQAVGDSVLAWNGWFGAAIPDVVGGSLGRGTQNNAVSGAQFLTGAIPAQYGQSGADWVIVNGGANDLANTCGCQRCDGVLNSLVSADGENGAIPAFVAQVRGQGPRVVLLGYYGTSIEGGAFAPCADELTILGDRLARLAARDAGITYVSAKDVIRPDDLAAYATDRVHPSRRGSSLIGEQIARAITAAESP